MNIIDRFNTKEVLVVKKIVDQSTDMFHYLGVCAEDTKFKPCESVTIHHLKSNLKFPAILYPDETLSMGEVSISTELCESKDLELGSLLEIKPLYNIPPIEGIKIVPLFLDEKKPISSGDRFSISKKLFDRLKYTYINTSHKI